MSKNHFMSKHADKDSGTNWVRDTDDSVINHEIHYDVLFARTEHSYINNYPIEFSLFNYLVRDILLDTPWRITETCILFNCGRT